MSHKTKKLEILDIDDIKSLENKNLSKKVNHYLQKTLFTIRILFRHNEENIDDLIDFYYYNFKLKGKVVKCHCSPRYCNNGQISK